MPVSYGVVERVRGLDIVFINIFEIITGVLAMI